MLLRTPQVINRWNRWNPCNTVEDSGVGFFYSWVEFRFPIDDDTQRLSDTVIQLGADVWGGSLHELWRS